MTFLKSATKTSEYPQDSIPEVCLIGRSNVGKSSVINAIANEKVARTSNTPGRTQLINYFDFGKIRIVDLPGYGFAKLSKTQQLDISEMIGMYFKTSKNLKTVVQLCDANVITDLDQEMASYFKKLRINYFVVLNKIDKLNLNYLKLRLPEIAKYLNITEQQILLVSAKKKINIKELKNIIITSCK